MTRQETRPAPLAPGRKTKADTWHRKNKHGPLCPCHCRAIKTRLRSLIQKRTAISNQLYLA
jgi:hypothetical protein